jgi:hypothetical protein
MSDCDIIYLSSLKFLGAEEIVGHRQSKYEVR